MAVVSFSLFSLFFVAMVAYYYPQLDQPTYKPKTTLKVQPSYDFIVIGAGSAGSVVAGRLSEESDWTVAIFEAGDDETQFSMTPLFNLDLVGSVKDWNFTTVQQKEACLETNGFCIYPRGKIMGGSSGISGMTYMRGNKKDFDTWEQMGAKGWGFNEVNPYFLKSENMKDEKLAASKYHKKGGPLDVQFSRYSPPATMDVITAGIEIGLKDRDYNGEYSSAITIPQMNLNEAQRWSTSSAYLTPARKRMNLDVVKKAYVNKILIDSKTKKVTGIEYTKNGITSIVLAKKEVILSAGAIMSPKVLMLSGIGNKSQLDKFGIQTIANLPVGENFLDQTKIKMAYKFKGEVGIAPSTYLASEAVAQFTVNKTGPLSTNGLDVIVLFSTGKDIASEFPDLLCHVLFLNEKEPPKNSSIISFYPTVIHVASKGRVTLKSTDPKDPPLINPNYFGQKVDLDKTIEAMKIIEKLVKAKALNKYQPEWYLPEMTLCKSKFSNLDDFYNCVAKTYSSTMFHPVGSVRMGDVNDPQSVLTPDLQVIGIPNLRVIDASVMPTLPTGDPNAVVIMIGEKGADIIKKAHKGK